MNKRKREGEYETSHNKRSVGTIILEETELETNELSRWNSIQVGSLLVAPSTLGGANISVDEVSTLLACNKISGSWIQSILSIIEQNRTRVDLVGKANLPSSVNDVLYAWVEKEILPRVNNPQLSNPFKIPLVRLSKKFADIPLARGVMPYQNNENCVKLMTEVLLDNIRMHEQDMETRYQELLVNSSYFGMGKTRLGLEFLDLFRKSMQETHIRTEMEEIYGVEPILQLEKSELIYVDCRVYPLINETDLTLTVNTILNDITNFLGGYPTQESPCFIVLDEIGAWIETHSRTISSNSFSNRFISMYNILNQIIFPLQKIHGISLYVCGKGAYLDIIGKGRLTIYTSPTTVRRVVTDSFSIGNIENILVSIPSTSRLHEYNTYTYFLNKLFEETKGIPYFVQFYLKGMYKFLNSLASSEGIDNYFETQRDQLAPSMHSPFNQFIEEPISSNVYKHLLIAGIFSLPINTKAFDANLFGKLQETNSEFKGLKGLDYIDVASMLNCYLQPVGGTSTQYLLLFPKPVVDSFLKSGSTHVTVPQLSLVEENFEYSIIKTMEYRIKWGFIQQLQIGEVIPPLKFSSVGSLACKPLNITNFQKKSSKLLFYFKTKTRMTSP